MQLFSNINELKTAYKTGLVNVETYLTQLLENIRADEHNAWISVISDNTLRKYLAILNKTDKDLPLWGVPFAVKDNIDLIDLPTTAGCREYSYKPKSNAFAVNELIKAGAVPMGKTNLDQFATGLVGTRSPFGACKNSINPKYVSGGSSSGSAVAVATSQVMFALGTDTAGSGRVPAAFNNIVGLKGTCGRVSCTGVVPACKSIDCLTVFARNTDDLNLIFSVISKYDREDCYSRKIDGIPHGFSENFCFGIPDPDDLEFFSDDEAERLYYESIMRFKELGGIPVKFKLRPFLEAAKLLYEGSFVTERLSGNKEFFDNNLDKCLEVIQTIIGNSRKFSAADAYNNNYRLAELKRLAYEQLSGIDFAVIPTTGTIYRINEVNEDPISLNSNLGYYTNFMNLLDFCALALPAGFRNKGPKEGLPFGITIFSRAFYDEALLKIGAGYCNLCKYKTGANMLEYMPNSIPTLLSDTMDVAVFGAHLKGMPLHNQLQKIDAYFVERTVTAPHYRMYLLRNSSGILKPGVVMSYGDGSSIELELYRIKKSQIGDFLDLIPYPLGLGKVELFDGRWVTGFICERDAVKGCMDISSYGGFRNYIEQELSGSI